MKQRLHIALMLLPDPAVLFPDEPTIGMDPIGAKQDAEALRELER
jgi:ABC-2 type transport system ATP-binding protein